MITAALNPSSNVLHVGCGYRPLPDPFRGWREWRLDIDPDCHPDFVGSMTQLPVDDQSMQAIYSSHCIEHLAPHDVVRFLRESYRVLDDTGLLILFCPDLQPAAERIAQDRLEEPLYHSPAGPIYPLDMVYGHTPQLEARPYMAHRTGFTQNRLLHCLRQQGFYGVVFRCQPAFELRAMATKVNLLLDDWQRLVQTYLK